MIIQSWIFISKFNFYDCKNLFLYNRKVLLQYVSLVFKVVVKVVGVTEVAPLPLLLRSVNDVVQEDWFPVDAAAADVDGDVPQGPHFPLLVCVSNQHLRLHLLAVVEVGAAASVPRSVAEDLRYCF